MAIDGKILEISKMPARKATRKHDVYWNYDLDGRPHQLSVRLLNPNGQNSVTVYSVFEQTIK